MSFQLKNDQYREHRGGHSRLLDLHCEQCESRVAIYQKDGPGELKYVYLDRIFFPDNLTRLEDKSLEELSAWDCSDCNSPLGVPFIFKKDSGKYAGEERLAFRLFAHAIVKKPRNISSAP